MALLNGGLSAAIGLIGYFVLGNLFDITTPLQLVELSRPTHPLLRQLLLKAPGTYHHTILVSNMAERAAAAIGADALLVRVGAYYHDIGKTVRPYFFAENIMDVTSPHEKLDPLTSAQIIISHVKDGVELAQNHHLPDRIQDFIREHHGRSLVRYFYMQAVRQANPDEVVNEEDFRYPGPNPHSKEAAILLLADTCEAAVRAVRPASREELAALVNRLIDERTLSGELDSADLTFRELQMVQNIFLQVLQGVHHPRIVYPEPAKHAPPGEQGVRSATPQPANARAGQERPRRAVWKKVWRRKLQPPWRWKGRLSHDTSGPATQEKRALPAARSGRPRSSRHRNRHPGGRCVRDGGGRCRIGGSGPSNLASTSAIGWRACGRRHHRHGNTRNEPCLSWCRCAH